jgi:hypothetical protein
VRKKISRNAGRERWSTTIKPHLKSQLFAIAALEGKLPNEVFEEILSITLPQRMKTAVDEAGLIPTEGAA